MLWCQLGLRPCAVHTEYIYTYIIYVCRMYGYMYLYLYIYIYSRCTYLYTHMHIFIYTHIYTCAYIYIYIYTCVWGASLPAAAPHCPHLGTSGLGAGWLAGGLAGWLACLLGQLDVSARQPRGEGIRIGEDRRLCWGPPSDFQTVH